MVMVGTEPVPVRQVNDIDFPIVVSKGIEQKD